MVSEIIETSPYMTSKMSVLNKHIDAGVKEISEYIEFLYNNYSKKVNKTNEHSQETASSLDNQLDEIQDVLNQHKDTFSLVSALSGIDDVKSEIRNLKRVLKDLKPLSPILSNNLNEIITNMKPLIVQMIFEPSHYDDMFILNKQAQVRLDQMAKQLEVVVNGLNENEGAAVRALDTSASTIQKNMKLINQELKKLSLY